MRDGVGLVGLYVVVDQREADSAVEGRPNLGVDGLNGDFGKAHLGLREGPLLAQGNFPQQF